MKTFSQGITKQQFVDEMLLHQKLDNFLKGTYSEGSKGCAVGCAIKSISNLTGKDLDCSNHSLYEQYAGIPTWIARLEDNIFEGVSEERAKKWPVEFFQAIPEGVDLESVRVPFLVVVLNNNIAIQEKNLGQIADESIKKIIEEAIEVNKQMIEALLSNDKEKIKIAKEAARSVKSAAESAWFAATESAAWSAESVAWSAAWSAAESAARSAAARSATESASWSARSAEYIKAYDYFADELLKLLRECK